MDARGNHSKIGVDDPVAPKPRIHSIPDNSEAGAVRSSAPDGLIPRPRLTDTELSLGDRGRYSAGTSASQAGRQFIFAARDPGVDWTVT